MLKKVLRDTPRAVLTYIYTPFPQTNDVDQSKYTIYDIHICLDHLWSLQEGDRATKSKSKRHNLGEPSHEFNILKASRFRDKNGNYVIHEHLFSKQFDLVGKNNPYRDRLAVAIISSVVNMLNEHRIHNINWKDEINLARRTYMGDHYYETLEDKEEREKRQREWKN